MRRFFRLRSRLSLPFILLFAVVLAGCQSPNQRPSPEDTVVTGSDPAERPDWVDVTEVYGEGAEGLSMRDEAFNETEEGRLMAGYRLDSILEPVYFGFDAFTLTPEARDKVEAAAEHLREHPADRLLIEGHCDWRGTADYNLALGDRRATSVRDYLIELGIDADRIEVLSMGDLEATPEADDATMAQDRRAELIIVR